MPAFSIKRFRLPGLEILEIRAFRRLWVGQAVSQFGDALYTLLFLFMVDKLTGKAAMVGYVGALEAAPFLLFGPYAGVLADRLDRRRIMLFADLVSALVLAGLCVVLLVYPKPHVGVIFAAAFLLSTVNAFFAPAKSAAIPALVPAERLMEANALSAATQHLMPLLGLGISGVGLGLLYALYPNLFFCGRRGGECSLVSLLGSLHRRPSRASAGPRRHEEAGAARDRRRLPAHLVRPRA